MKYKYILFDFDGTVINSIPAIVNAVKETFQHFDFPLPPEEEIRRYIGIPLQKYFPYLAREYYERHDPEEVMAYYRHIYETKYSRTHLSMFEGMTDLLRTLQDSGHKLGIVSSKMTEPMLSNMQQMQIEQFFDAVVGSDQVRLYKPLPETVFLCARELGVEDIREAIVIGDSPKDIEMAQRAGCVSCAVPWGAGTEDELQAANPDYFAKTVPALKDVLMAESRTG